MTCIHQEKPGKQLSMVMQLFEHWAISEDEQRALLGAETDSSNQQQERIQLLLSTHAWLRTLFPYNRDLVYAWVTTENADFGCRPLDIMVQGLEGLRRIEQYLWNVTDR
ncbi:MAG: antitoxin Xre/MbcA/ParS toxin-binding domain-containing protein [Geobacter sp.]